MTDGAYLIRTLVKTFLIYEETISSLADTEQLESICALSSNIVMVLKRAKKVVKYIFIFFAGELWR